MYRCSGKSPAISVRRKISGSPQYGQCSGDAGGSVPIVLVRGLNLSAIARVRGPRRKGAVSRLIQTEASPKQMFVGAMQTPLRPAAWPSQLSDLSLGRPSSAKYAAALPPGLVSQATL